MGYTRQLGQLAYLITYDGSGNITVPAALTQGSVTSSMLKADSSGKLVAAVAGTDFVAPAGLSSYVPTTRTITINGTAYDLSADRSWSIVSGVSSFNTRTGAIELGDTDVTGALGYTPVTNARTITINGTSYDLSANRSWTIVAGLSSFNTRTGDITLLDTDVTGALGYTPVTNARTITINGTTYDLSANRTWVVDTSSVTTRVIQKFTATSAQTAFTITGGYTVGMVDVFLNGIKLDNAVDFTATDGSVVTLAVAAATGDIVEVYKYGGQFIANNTLRQSTLFTATAGQTTFTVNYSVGFVDVFYNGSKLDSSEFTATNGTSIVFGTACVLNDKVEVVAYNYTVGAFTGVGGSGTANTIAKWTASGTLNNSIIKDSGTVGINMSPDANMFSITGAANNWGLSVFSSTTTGQSYGAIVRGGTNASDVAFKVNNAANNTTYFTVNGDGKVGIGTTGPSATLSVVSSISNTTSANIYTKNTASISYSGLDMYNDTNVEFFIGVGGSASPSGYTNTGFLETYSTTPIAFRTNGAERLRITSGGNVGIGTTSPNGGGFGSTTMTINSPNSTYATLELGKAVASTSSNLGVISFYNGANYDIANIIGVSEGANNSGALRLCTVNAGSFAEKMRISSNGNIGIGTTSPSEKLHIVGGGNGPEIKLEGSWGSHYIRSYNDNFNFYVNSVTQAMRINNAGIVTVPNQPSFSMGCSSLVTGPSVVAAGRLIFNNGGYYNTSTYRFTAPVAGKYFFSFYDNIFPNDTSPAQFYFRVNGTRRGAIAYTLNKGTSWYLMSFQQVISLNSGDYVDVYNQSNDRPDYGSDDGWGNFSGYLIG